MVKHSFGGCFLLLALGMLSANGMAQGLGTPSSAHPTPARRVGYALPRHLQQYADPMVNQQAPAEAIGSNVDSVEYSEDFGVDPDGAEVGGDVVGEEPWYVYGDSGGGYGRVGRSPWSAGVEFTLVKPHFENNTAFTTSDTDDATFETLTDTDFNFDTEFAPRVWIERLGRGDYGLRITYWQFDYGSADVSGSPPANGLGSITHPPFGDVDLSTTTPGSVFSASSELNAYTIDFEGTKSFAGGSW